MDTNRSPLWQIAGISALTSLVLTTVVLFAVVPQWSAGKLAQQRAASSGSTAIIANPDLDIADASASPIVRTVQAAEPAVVSVIISKDVPIIERSYGRSGDPFFDSFGFGFPQYVQRGTERREVGGGTAFFIRSDGLLMTNRHVVSDEDAEYTVFLNDGRKLTAKVLARDPGNDVALLQVEGSDFPALQLSDGTEPLLGQTVVAIGNSLGEFRNTVSVGVVSGLQRSITAGGLLDGTAEELTSIIQTDAAINQGNSGGPLLDLHGNVIGMNTAVAGGAQNIAFAIPAIDLLRSVRSYEQYGRIVRPSLGVRYVHVTTEVQKEKNLSVNYGALIIRGEAQDEPAILSGSAAEKAGLREGDVILEVDGTTLTPDVSLVSIIQRKLPSETLILKILRDGKELDVSVTLEEWREEN